MSEQLLIEFGKEISIRKFLKSNNIIYLRTTDVPILFENYLKN